jgi:hypothetical protein
MAHGTYGNGHRSASRCGQTRRLAAPRGPVKPFGRDGETPTKQALPRSRFHEMEAVVTSVGQATSRPSATGAGISVSWLAKLIRQAIARRLAAGRDRRALQAMPGYLLTDLGLEKLEFRSSADGRRDVWVIPHRYS